MKELVSFKFNQAGIIHNLTLDAISKLPNFPNISNEESYYMGIKVVNSIFNYHCNDVKYPSYSEIEPYYNLIKGDDSYIVIINELLKNGIISEELAEEMKYHYNNLIVVDNYDKLQKEVLNFIKHFKANSKLSEIEVIICWYCASVTMFSYNYWNDVEFNPENPWYSIYHKNDKTKTKGKFWHIVGVIAADCAGALVGGAAGSVFGPTGAAYCGAAAVGAASKVAAG